MRGFKCGIRALAASGLIWAGALAPSPAAAQAGYESVPPFDFFDVQPTEQLNVPDANGCVKQCIEDLSPCDPPIFKHADGRCSQRRKH